MRGRYNAVGPEAEFEPGSGRRVLRNRLGVTSVREMKRRESNALLATTEHMINETRVGQRFAADDVRRMHRLWLDKIYVWAGDYRQVNIAKGDFMFAAANRVPSLMEEFEYGVLREYTPCGFETVDEQAAALAIVHAEFILIHPFREGNGRCGRLLATLMGLQAGLPQLDFRGIRGASRTRYFAAVRAALGGDYAPMINVFRGVIKKTLRAASKPSSA